MECYNEAEYKLAKRAFMKNQPTTSSEECNCLPSCTSITYDAEISQAKYDNERAFVHFGIEDPRFVSNGKMENLYCPIEHSYYVWFCRSWYFTCTYQLNYVFSVRPSRIVIFFKEQQFITSKRAELYGSTDFLAYLGGFLGLFLGVSVLSVIEVIYYFTLKMCCTMRIVESKKPQQNGDASDGIDDTIPEI